MFPAVHLKDSRHHISCKAPAGRVEPPTGLTVSFIFRAVAIGAHMPSASRSPDDTGDHAPTSHAVYSSHGHGSSGRHQEAALAVYRQNAGGASSHTQGTEFMESGVPGFGETLAAPTIGDGGLTNGVAGPAPLGKSMTAFVDNVVLPAMQDEEPVRSAS
jgi:hypothetical protein